MNNMKMHPGCGCEACRRGRDKDTRATFHKKVRLKQKAELKKNGEVDNINLGIGYTD